LPPLITRVGELDLPCGCSSFFIADPEAGFLDVSPQDPNFWPYSGRWAEERQQTIARQLCPYGLGMDWYQWISNGSANGCRALSSLSSAGLKASFGLNSQTAKLIQRIETGNAKSPL